MSILGRDSINSDTLIAFEDVYGVEQDGHTIILRFVDQAAARKAKLAFANQVWLETQILKSNGHLTPNVVRTPETGPDQGAG
jgi:hypothetical protein